ncbi:YcnI family protein [Amycolatopsis acidiphila]|uniref:YcnI family protein n=1 Tax=Amycolatopsis acidiphila TaxID=715473 RepID=A0A558AM95_9PSEU|nr:YcnI family protein [Amycolatopsis acidiphila]
MLSLTGVASAHVTANPNTAQQGGYAKVSFRVPTERDNASTTQLEIDFPAEHPLASVSTRAVPGWTAKVEKTPLAKPITTDDGQLTEAVSKIVWTGGKIPPGSFEEFDVSMGPLPADTDQLVFKALQTYDNGEVVRWIDTTTPGGPEAEHPAPVLKLTPKADATTSAAVSPAASSTGSGSGSSTGTVLGVIAIVLAALALALSVFTRLRSRPGTNGAGAE